MGMPYEEPVVRVTPRTYSYVIYGNGRREFCARRAGILGWLRACMNVEGPPWSDYNTCYARCRQDAEVQAREHMKKKRKRLKVISFVE